MNPYHDINIGKGVFLREFSPDVEESELIWHRDYKVFIHINTEPQQTLYMKK
mgnify:CR=1 FL=1